MSKLEFTPRRSMFLMVAAVLSSGACASVSTGGAPVGASGGASGGASNGSVSAEARERSDAAAIAKARADSARYPYTVADVAFMTGMIHHHAQAIEMAEWAPSHGASASVRTLAERIINAQRDEIGTMQRWLADRLQPVPRPAVLDSMHDMPHDMEREMSHGADQSMKHDMAGMRMPGMLTEAQMTQLGAARGSEFDRLFLTYMIQHHRGALTMVRDLFGSYGAAQDELVFKFANDVNVDQTTEIARMERMLVMITLGARAP